MASTTRPVVIIGGGIAGNALALFLKRVGIPCAVYEAYPESAINVRAGGLQLAPNGVRVLAALGLDQKALAAGSEADSMLFRNHAGKVITDVCFQKRELYGFSAINMSRRALHEVVYTEMQSQGVPMFFSKRLSAIENLSTVPKCVFEDGTSVEAALVIGADGLNSQVRSIILPDGPKPEYTGILNVGGFVDTSVVKPEHLPKERTLEMTFGRAGFFGLGWTTPSVLMWWTAIPTETPVSRERIASITDAEIVQESRQLLHGWHQPVDAVLDAAQNIFYGNIMDVQSLPTWHRGKVCLIGDAAHAVSPHSGQGASLALEDAIHIAALLRPLADAENTKSIETIFGEFEKLRRERCEHIVKEGRRSGSSKKPVGAITAWIRDKFLGYFMGMFMRRMADSVYRVPLPDI